MKVRQFRQTLVKLAELEAARGDPRAEKALLSLAEIFQRHRTMETAAFVAHLRRTIESRD